MLEPDQRHLLLDALRPPPGTTLDAAVGTTFSLDLEALLLAPIAFALFDARLAEDGDPARTDPLAVMEAVRRHASRIDLFCQAGQISIPPRDRPVLALLEDSVHPASAPSAEHIFHPKVWCLRFIGGDLPRFRLLVLSRNLTFDRSWDTIVSIEGTPVRSNRELRAGNQPLADFVAALPGLSGGRPLNPDRLERINTLADELLHIEWEKPDGVGWIRFLPSGVEGYESTWPNRADRTLVISPFLTAGQLDKIANSSERATLVSRAESLDLIDRRVLDRFEVIYILDDSVDETGESQETTPPPTREELAERPGATSTGIHAKVLVADQGWDAELRTGSTNATTAGWSGNVEFDISLHGSKKRLGVNAVLGVGMPGTSLLNMLAPYQRASAEPLEESESDKVAYRLERLGRNIARLALLARVEPDGDRYRIILTSDRPLPHAEMVTISCWPVSRHPDTAQTQTPGQPVHLTEGALSLQALTSFFAFELTASTDSGPISTRIVNNARMVGAPEDRTERLLLEQLQTKGDVLRYLLFLLADIGDEGAFEFAHIITGSGETDRDWMPQIPLLESMVRALSRYPEALVPIHRLITDLQKTQEGTALLPEGLDQIWPAIWEAKSRIP